MVRVGGHNNFFYILIIAHQVLIILWGKIFMSSLPNIKVRGTSFSRVKRALYIIQCIILILFLMIIVLYSYEKLQRELQVKR